MRRSAPLGKQRTMLLPFSGLLLVGALRVWSVPPEPKRLT
jgi:hypothetical protein